jgi:hypothetical protein
MNNEEPEPQAGDPGLAGPEAAPSALPAPVARRSRRTRGYPATGKDISRLSGQPAPPSPAVAASPPMAADHADGCTDQT